jgi:Zn-dependent metalloprotease
MRENTRLARLAATALLVVMIPAAGSVQEPVRKVSVAARTLDELRQWDPVVDGLLRDGTLSLHAQYDDPQLAGRRHEGLIQYHRGLPVYGGDVTRQTERGVTVSLFGTIYAGIDLDLTPRLTVEDVRRTVENLAGATIARKGDPTLMILPTLDERLALAYRATMGNAVTYFVDAHDGGVLMELEEVMHQTATGRGVGALGDVKKMSTTLVRGAYHTRDGLRPAPVLTLDTRASSASFARLRGGGRWSDSDLAVDTDNDWTHSAVVDTHVHMGWVYDYFFKNHGYQGLNNRNTPIIGVVATRALLPNNAFFILPPFGPDGGGGFFFGEGPSEAPVTTLDVVGHELTHGVTFFAVSQRTGRRFGPTLPLDVGPASIVFAGDTFPCTQTTIGGLPFFCSNGRYVTTSDHAGAINEGLSDIFGTAVEFAFQPGGSGPLRADYLTGEDLREFGPLRSLQNPGSLIVNAASGVAYPDHYSRRFGFALAVLPNGLLTLTSLALVDGVPVLLPGTDGGGVHWNSTILSHAFYLAIEGGQNSTSGRAVQGVGAANRGQIEQVFFRALRDLFPSSLTFAQAGIVIRQAAVDLFGESGAATRAIDQAFTAVGL